MNIVKHSKKRDLIYDILQSTTSHPSAEWIYNKAKAKIPDLSLATVYRNLALFCKQGEAVCIATVKGQERYDANTKTHTHFICDECGEIIDIFDCELQDVFFDELEEKYDIEINSYSLILNGKCESCKNL